MPYAKKFRISEEGNVYPVTDETFVSDEVAEDLNNLDLKNEYYQFYDLPYHQRVMMDSMETVDFNRQF